jgi:hypothetical protein
MKAELNPHARIKAQLNYVALSAIEQTIKARVAAEFSEERATLQKENDTLHAEQRAFEVEATTILRTCTVQTKLKIKTLTIFRDGNTLIRVYNGHLANKFTSGIFDFIDNDVYDGKPFGIGLSHLLAIEVVE